MTGLLVRGIVQKHEKGTRNILESSTLYKMIQVHEIAVFCNIIYYLPIELLFQLDLKLF